MDKFTHSEQTVLVFAARYSHTRRAGGSLFVVEAILKNWERLSESTQKQLIEEAKNEATCNMRDWERIIEKNNRS